MKRTALRRVSAKRSRQNRERRAMVNGLYPERPHCARPGCPRMADDLHEPLTRARGGSITDKGNQVPLCRPCHDEITFSPESELQWAYDAGLLVHSWDAAKATPRVLTDALIAASVAAITRQDAAELLGSLGEIR